MHLRAIPGISPQRPQLRWRATDRTAYLQAALTQDVADPERRASVRSTRLERRPKVLMRSANRSCGPFSSPVVLDDNMA